MKLSVAVSALVVGLATAGFSQSPGKAPERDRPEPGARGATVMEVKIGAVLPMSGVVASDGEAGLRGLQIAEADINRREDLPFRVRLLPKDGKFEPRESLNAFNLLVSQDVAGMILIGDNTCQMTKAQVVKQRIPTIASMVVTAKSVKGNPWMVRCWPPIATSAGMMGRYMRESCGLKRAAVFHIDAMYGLESLKAFGPAFERDGCRIVATESFPFITSDLRGRIGKLLQKEPDGIFVTGFAQGLITAINQLREAGWTKPIYTDTAVVDPRVKKNLSSLRGIFFVGNAFDEERQKGGAAADFARKYADLSGDSSGEVPPQALFAYTAAQLMVRALAEARGDRDRVREELSGARDFPSVLGPVNYDAEREIVLPLYIKTFGDDGRNKLVDDMLWKRVVR